MKSFELVTAISESPHSVDIEGVFPLTDGGDSLLQPGDVCLLIGFLTVVWDEEHKHQLLVQNLNPQEARLSY